MEELDQSERIKKAAERYENWLSSQKSKGKSKYVTPVDKQIFAQRFNVTVEEMESLKNSQNGI